TFRTSQCRTATAIRVSRSRKPRQKLEALACTLNQPVSSLAKEAKGQYVSPQEWLIREIGRGVAAADPGELVDEQYVKAWLRSIGAVKYSRSAPVPRTRAQSFQPPPQIFQRGVECGIESDPSARGPDHSQLCQLCVGVAIQLTDKLAVLAPVTEEL